MRPGGAALYAAVTAQRLGLSRGDPHLARRRFPARELLPPADRGGERSRRPRRPVFEHRAERRRARHARDRRRAAPRPPPTCPRTGATPDIVMLRPRSSTKSIRWWSRPFADGSVGAAVQGYLRGLGADGRVTARVRGRVPTFVLDHAPGRLPQPRGRARRPGGDARGVVPARARGSRDRRPRGGRAPLRQRRALRGAPAPGPRGRRHRRRATSSPPPSWSSTPVTAIRGRRRRRPRARLPSAWRARAGRRCRIGRR